MSTLTKEYFEEVLTKNTQEIIGHFNQSQSMQNERMDKMETHLERIESDLSDVKIAVLELVGTDRALHNLVRELKSHGIPLKERRIFPA